MAVRRLAVAGIRLHHPFADDDEVRARLAARLYGRACAERLFGPLPQGEMAALPEEDPGTERDPEEPMVIHTPDVCFGAARLANTRIPVWVLVRARQSGDSDAFLLQNYPTIQQRHLDATWAYYEQHRDEIDEAIRYQDEEWP